MATLPMGQPSRAEWRLVTWIAVPSLALAFCLTVVSAYVPVLLEEFTDSGLAIGALISGEGLAALLIPVLVSTWSDGLQTRLGPRLPILIAATPIAVGGLVMVAFGSSLLLLVVALFLFYAAYFAYFGPYLALYPDLIRDEVQGRAQGANGVARQLGLGLGLVAGGALLAASQSLPFIAAAVVLALATIALVARLRTMARMREARAPTEGRVLARAVDLLRRRPEIRRVVFVNALWELSVAALKTFGILFAIVGLGLAPEAIPVSVGLIAVGVVAGALTAGRFADRYGAYRLLRIIVWPYGLGLLAPFLSQSSGVLVTAMPLVAFGAGAVTTLAYVALVRAAPADARGAASGLFGLSRGVGVLLGPLLAGLAVEALEPVLTSTHGYAAAWLVAALAVLATVPVLGRLCRSEPLPFAGSRRPRPS
jgi:MFS family permease